MDNFLDKIQLKNAIRLLIGGWLYDGDGMHDVNEIEKILKELAEDYQEAIKKNL